MKQIRLFIITLALWQSFRAVAQPSSQPLSIGRSAVLHSGILKEDRTINIYLPAGYDTTGATKYPVIYILDGGMEEDFVHLVGLVRFNSQSWIGRIPASIVVGIENTNRRRDFTFAVPNLDFLEKEGFKKDRFPQYGNSANYITFLEKELQPYIAAQYQTSEKKTLIGESMAGLVASEILLKKPSLFTDYIIISPSLWWGGGKLLKEAGSLLKEHLKQPVKVYIGAPSKEEDMKMYGEVEQLFMVLQRNKKINVCFDYMPEEKHATVIHQAVYNAFKIWNRSE